MIIILYISSFFTSVKSMSQLVLSRSASILAQLMSSLKKFKSLAVAQVAFLNLLILFFFYNFYVCFNLNYIVVTHWCFGDDYLCRVSWSLLVRKSSCMLFFLVGSSIYCCKHCKRHLLEPDFHGFHRLLFPFTSQ